MSENYRIRIFGHDWAQRLLRGVVLSGSSSHAYLFVGPDRVGKTTLARAFAQALTCESPQAEVGLGACGQCRSCRLAAERGYPDHRFIEPGGGQIKIEQIRDLIHEAALSPVEGRYKIFIVRSFDRANPNAANALLKTLEEPSDSTRILLTSSQSSSLLPTITSRCQVLHLRPLPQGVVSEALQQGWGVASDRAELLAGLSGGRLGWAVEMATNPDAWQAHEDRLAAILQLVQQDDVDRLAFAEKLTGDGEIEETLREWLLWWRDVLLVQEGWRDLIVNRDRVGDVQDLAAATDVGEVRRFLEALMTTAGYLRLNVSLRLALESLLLKAPHTT